MHADHNWKQESLVIKEGVHQLSNLNGVRIWSYRSPTLPLGPLLVESVAMAAAASSQARCIHPSPWTMVVPPKLPISLSDRLERRRRLCEYILINRNGRALGGEEKWGWGKIGRKSDVGREGSERESVAPGRRHADIPLFGSKGWR